MPEVSSRKKIKVLVRHEPKRNREGDFIGYRAAAFERVQEIVGIYGGETRVKTSSGDVWNVVPTPEGDGFNYTTLPW